MQMCDNVTHVISETTSLPETLYDGLGPARATRQTEVRLLID